MGHVVDQSVARSAWRVGLAILLAASGLAALHDAAAGEWEAPEGTPYAASEAEVVSTPANRGSLVFRDGVLAWVETPGEGQVGPGKLAFLDTRSGASGNLDRNGTDSVPRAQSNVLSPMASGTHIAWFAFEEWMENPPLHLYALSLRTREVTRISDAPLPSSLASAHLSGSTLAWVTHRDGEAQVHRTDLENGTTETWTFPLGGVVEAWPMQGFLLVLRQDGYTEPADRPSNGVYQWAPPARPELLTNAPLRRISPGLAVDGKRLSWDEYRGDSTSVYQFDLQTGNETRLTFSRGRQNMPTVSGDLLAWADLRSERMCGDFNCPPRYNLYFSDVETHNEYKLEGTWDFSAGPALDGRQLAYGDSEGRLRLATLPAPEDLLVASVDSSVRPPDSSTSPPAHNGTAQPQGATTPAGGPEASRPCDGQVCLLEMDLTAPGRVVQRWDSDLDGTFETEGPLRVPVGPGDPTPIPAAFGYVVDASGRTAAMGVDVQKELERARAAVPPVVLPVQIPVLPSPPSPVPPSAAPAAPADEAAPVEAEQAAAAQPEAPASQAAVDVQPMQADVGPDPKAEEGAPLAVAQAPARSPSPATGLALGAAGTVAASGVALAAVRPGWLRRVLPLALFSRLDPAAALGHPVRSELASLIEANPGIHYQELVRRVGRGRGLVEHHLASLLRSGLVVRRDHGGYTCYFHRDASLDPRLQEAYAALKAPGARGVLAALSRSPASSGQSLADGLRLSATTVSYHLHRLERAGVLSRERLGGRTRYALTPVGRQALAGCAA